MNLIDCIVRGSQQVVVIDPKSRTPKGFGSGVTLEYRDKIFLISVAHVTDYDNLQSCIEIGVHDDKFGSQLYSVGSMQFFDIYQYDPDLLKSNVIGSLEDIINVSSRERLDLTMVQLQLDKGFRIAQGTVNLGAFGIISGGEKIFLRNVDFNLSPKESKHFAFYGTVQAEVAGNVLHRKGQFAYDLTYSGEHDVYYAFKLPKPIKDERDYKGTSGAPIFDEQGRLMGIVSHYKLQYPDYIFAISNSTIKKYLDYFIQFESDARKDMV